MFRDRPLVFLPGGFEHVGEQRCNKGAAGARTEALIGRPPRVVDLPCREGVKALYLTACLAGPLAHPALLTTRWFVEVSPVDADPLKERYCVEAIQWQQALQQARKIRGDRGALSRFSIELL